MRSIKDQFLTAFIEALPEEFEERADAIVFAGVVGVALEKVLEGFTQIKDIEQVHNHFTPGPGQTLHAVGRVIRIEDDHGVVEASELGIAR